MVERSEVGYHMSRAYGFFCRVVLAAFITAAVTSTGCAVRVRTYDPYYHDYHRWDHDEDRAYRRFLDERHERYRDFKGLDSDEQQQYWRWRHDHKDADRR